MDWLLTFGQKVLAIPGLHAILAAWCAGVATTYGILLMLPYHTQVKHAVLYARIIVFFVVMTVALSILLTPVMFAWAFTVAILTPASYEMLTNGLFHRWPHLKPKALMTSFEMENRIADKEGK